MAQVKESLSVLVIPFDDTLGMILWCIFVGVCLSLVSIYSRKLSLGRGVKILLEKKAFSKESAVALPKNTVPSSALSGRERMIGKVEEDGTVKFYLPEENKEKAEAVLKGAKTPLWLALVELLGLYAVLFVIYQVLPLILDGFSNL